jgi:hypothetical protein
MKTYDYLEAQRNFHVVFNAALKEEVVIARKDGSKYKLAVINNPHIKGELPGKSPLVNIKGIQANVDMDDILKAIREGREQTRMAGDSCDEMPEYS